MTPRLFKLTTLPYAVLQMVDASLYGGRIAHGSGQRFNYEYSLLPSLPALGYTTVYMQSSLPFDGRSVWARYSWGNMAIGNQDWAHHTTIAFTS